MSALAREQGAAPGAAQPTSTLISKFALGNEGVFGIGTFYGDNDFFHLFESREPAYEQLLVAVADDAIAQRPLQVAQYLEAAIALQQGTPLVKRSAAGGAACWVERASRACPSSSSTLTAMPSAAPGCWPSCSRSTCPASAFLPCGGPMCRQSRPAAGTATT